MRCPTCGFAIDQQQLDRCPNCGTPLPAHNPTTAWSNPAAGDVSGQPSYTAPSSGEPPQMPPASPVSPTGPAGPAGPQMPPQYYPYPPSSAPYAPPAEAPAPAAPESPYGAPPNPSPSNPYGGYGGYAPPSGYGAYGGYAPPSGYGQPQPYSQPYGQPQPYSQPLPGGYPIAPGYPPGYAPPSYPLPRLAPLPERKRRTGLIVTIVALVVVVLAACTWGVAATVQGLHLPTNASGPKVTPIPIYGNTFKSQANGWPSDTHCSLEDDGYHIKNNYTCFAPLGNESDVDVQVDVRQVSGSTRYPMGIVFRLLDSGSSFNRYGFSITSNGSWEFLKCSQGACERPINFRPSSAIHTGIGSSNTLEVSAKGTHFDLLINGIGVGSLDDSTFSYGEVGLSCGDGIECVFTDFQVGEID